jgi:hypothetical protein
MKYIHAFFIVFILLSGRCFAQEAIDCPQIIEFAQKNLPHCGVLKMSNGFVYVDVDDAYVHDLVGFIQDQGFEEPPYFGKVYSAGAHISVMYKDETAQYGIQKIDECGQKICFTLKSCQVVHPPTWKEIDEVYLIVVDAPELHRIRKKYGMPRGYAFHITIGVKPKVEKAA